MFTVITYTSILQCMGQGRECIQHPRMVKAVLLMSSLIIQICLNYRVNLSSIDTETRHMEPFTDITIRRSMSVRPDQLLLTPNNNLLPNLQV